jgi:starch synthase
MHIAMVSGEAVPYAKTGGLADVCGALPVQFARSGHRCTLYLPAYRPLLEQHGGRVADTGRQVTVSMPGWESKVSILSLPTGVEGYEVRLIHHPESFDRPELYGDRWGAYGDNCERFCLFGRAVLEALVAEFGSVDLVHCHDWQAGLIPAWLATGAYRYPSLRATASVTTIHNLAYQGRFPKSLFGFTGLGEERFNLHELEFFGDFSLLKAAIVYADAITTVSPTYAKEIQTAEHGCGLEGVLQSRQHLLHGIVNGVDLAIWNPATDPHLARRYSVDDFHAGKGENKRALQERMGLPVRPEVPMVGIVSRLAEQKGWDILLPVLGDWLSRTDVQWAIVGTGEARYHEALEQLSRSHPQKLGLRLAHDEPLSHGVEAGCDLFLMPSRYEPCGLNQLYSQLYGAVPVVHATGGLVDTVVPFGLHDAVPSQATGFHFHPYSSGPLHQALDLAVTLLTQDRGRWDQLVINGMRQDFSWSASAAGYLHLFSEVVARKQSGAEAWLG